MLKDGSTIVALVLVAARVTACGPTDAPATRQGRPYRQTQKRLNSAVR